jgi:hypothetical protein
MFNNEIKKIITTDVNDIENAICLQKKKNLKKKKIQLDDDCN